MATTNEKATDKHEKEISRLRLSLSEVKDELVITKNAINDFKRQVGNDLKRIIDRING